MAFGPGLTSPPQPPSALASPCRLTILDVGRAMACLFVVLHHANRDLYQDSITLFRYGFLGVEFFMILSGYLLAMPLLEGGGLQRHGFHLPQYYLKRAIRVLPAYYLAILVVAVCIFFGLGSRSLPVPVSELPWHMLAHATFLHTFSSSTFYSLVSVWWSMGLEWQYYMAFPFLLAVLSRTTPLRFMAVVLAATLAFRLSSGLWWDGWGFLMDGFLLARLTEFAGGMALAAWLGRRQGAALSPWLPIAWMGGLAVASGLLLSSSVWQVHTLGFQAGVFAAFLGLRFLVRLPEGSRVTASLAFLGQASYCTYLIHTIVGKCLLFLLARVGIVPGTPGMTLLLFLAYVGAGHLAGALFYVWFDRPVFERLSRWNRERGAVRAALVAGG